MISIDEMKLRIQEWMAQPLSAIELAYTYAEIKAELEKQLEFCMAIQIEDNTEEE